MTKLSFEYCDNSGDSIAEYNGLTIRAVQDSDAENPWESWDGNVPLVTYNSDWHRDGFAAYDKDSGVDLSRPFSEATISDSMLRRHMKALAIACDYTPQTLEREARDNQGRGDCLTYIKRDLLSDAFDNMRDGDKLETLATIYRAIGWPALCTSTRGYSQGDYVELLFVATPHFIKAMGAPSIKDSAYWRGDMEGAAALYGAWAWGDVYGYVIGTDDDDHIESCWGFYGTDFDKSGLADAAIDAADSVLSNARNRRNATLKTLIKNRVPLHMRAPLLDVASQFAGV